MHRDEHPYDLNALPPHIQARFFRRRRRSSSFAGTGKDSNPAAERAHTRRASILETRKNTLRARALHAEKVRLQCHKDSHEALAARLTALQKSLSQAQKSRNAILAKTAAACASEVAKAKQIAQEIKQKREEEAKALKEGMTDRLMEAEKRRLELQRSRRINRRARGSSSSVKADGEVSESLDKIRAEAEVEAKPSKEDAAIAIQRAYRLNRNRQIVKKFMELGLTVELVRDSRFDEITTLMGEERVQRATSRLLRLCGLLQATTGVSTAREDVVDTEKACRIFLSTYVILSHPSEILSNDGQDEKALITKSKDLLCAFESWVSSTSPTNSYLGSSYLRDALLSAWDLFSTAFSSWKERDSKYLLELMIKTYTELDLIMQKLKDDIDPASMDYKEGIREQQLTLLVRIRQLAGDKTRALLKKAVVEARRTRLPKKQDHRPRGVETEGSSEAAEPPPSPIVADTSTSAVAPAGPVPATSVPPRAEEPLLMGMTNREIVHELALDKNFRLKPRKKSQIEEIVERQAKRAFYDLMREAIERGDTEAWIPQMALAIRDKLFRLFEPSHSFHKVIDNAFDIPLIQQQCRVGSYDYEKLLAWVMSLLPKICSPARDLVVQELTQFDGDPITRLDKLLEVLDLLILDQANYTLMQSAVLLIPQAIPYERKTFSADLAAGRVTLNKTMKWLEKAREEKISEVINRPGLVLQDNMPSAEAVYNHAFVTLAISMDELKAEDFPETFHLDVERLLGYRDTVRKVVYSSALVLTVKNLLRRDVRRSWKSLRDKVFSLLDSHYKLDANAVVSFLQETTALPPAVQTQIRSACSRITNGTSDPVVRLLFARLRNFIAVRMAAGGNSRERAKLARATSETLAGFGMEEQIGEVGDLWEMIERLAGYNRVTYQDWYDPLLREIEGSSRRTEEQRGAAGGV